MPCVMIGVSGMGVTGAVISGPAPGKEGAGASSPHPLPRLKVFGLGTLAEGPSKDILSSLKITLGAGERNCASQIWKVSRQ